MHGSYYPRWRLSLATELRASTVHICVARKLAAGRFQPHTQSVSRQRLDLSIPVWTQSRPLPQDRSYFISRIVALQ